MRNKNPYQFLSAVYVFSWDTYALILLGKFAPALPDMAVRISDTDLGITGFISS